MKTKDVPQDNKKYDEQKLVVRDMVYALDENGKYTGVVSTGWDVKTEALDAVWDDILEECEPIRKQVLAKKISPLAYHMKRNLQDVAMLSAYSGIPKRKIKKHLEYDEFAKLDSETLQKYADALRMTVDDLKHVD